MADYATNLPTIPYDPMRGVQTLQGILGIQAQKLEIQKAQQDVQTAQAGAQQAQQRNRELTNLSGFTQKAMQDPAYKMPDGSPNIQKFQNDAMQQAPVYGQEAIGRATENFRSAVNTRRDLQSLSTDQNKALSGFFSSVAGMQNPTHDDILNAAGQARSNNTDPAFNRALDRALMNFDPALGPSDIKKRAGIAANTLGGMTGVTPTTVDTSTGVQGATQNNFTGALTPSGPPVAKNLTQAAAATAAGASRATGVAGSDIDRANQVSGNIKASAAGVQTTQQIDDLADQIHSGKFAAWISKNAAAAGMQESTYARQLLEKDLGMVKTQLTSAAPSDSRAATILSGTPEATSDPQTIHGAMDYVRGSFRQSLAQGDNLSRYRTKHPDLSGFQSADDAFTSTGGPLVHEFLSLKGKDQQSAFYRRNFSNAQEALEFRNRARAASHTLGLDNANR